MVESSKNRKRIYLLRHEQRGNKVSFETPLTPKGLENAETVICSQLEKLDIGMIYCSPFIRTLQTIKPFCDKTGMKINLEWGLVESFTSESTNPIEFQSIINSNYNSLIPYKLSDNTEVINFDLLKQRVKTFIESLDRSQNILLVTHMPVINAILSYRGFEWIEMYTHHKPGSLLSMSGDALLNPDFS